MTDRQMLWLSDPVATRRAVEAQRCAGRTVGLVPTMGNLHAGHRSLLRRARQETDFVVATLFVNPLQFGPNEDFARYPRTPDCDRDLCRVEGVDLVFAPPAAAMYPPDFCTRVQVAGLEDPLCGRHRPGHFVGVATVVAKLFHIAPADVAYFGAKDYQQARIIRQMVADLHFLIEIRLCPIVREPDGLALSSRNQYLSADERREAPVLKRALDLAATLVLQGERDPVRVRNALVELISSTSSGQVDYVELVDPETLQPAARLDRPVLAALAVRFGNTRLIDNALVNP